MSKFLFLSIVTIAITCNSLFSQEYHTITGTIKDIATKQSLAGVNIYLSKKAIGTVSNAEGQYKFSFPENLTKDTLFFSCIGYKTHKIPVSKILKSTILNIELEISACLLSEITVSSKVLTAKDILKLARKKYFKNHLPVENYNANMYFREYVREDSNYTRAREIAIKTYSKANKETIDLKVEQCRYAVSSKSKTSVKGDLGLGLIYEYSWFLEEYFRYKQKNDWNIRKDTILFYHNKFVYVISATKGTISEQLKNIYLRNIGNDYTFYNNIDDRFKNTTDRYGFYVYFISIDNFKIEKMFNYYHFGRIAKNKSKSTNEVTDLLRHTSSIEFIEKNNKMYPYHVFWFGESYIYKSVLLNKRVLKHQYTELVNNEIITNNVEIIPSESFGNALNELYINDNCKESDPEFWKTYNYLPDDKLKQQVLENIENQKKEK